MQPNNTKLQIKRYFTKPEDNQLNKIQFEKRKSEIVNEKNEVILSQDNVEVPTTWSQTATEIMTKLYLRKRGVPKKAAESYKEFENGKGDFRSYVEVHNVNSDDLTDEETTSENSIKQLAHRMAGTWTYWGEKYGYFESKEDVKAFYDELRYMIISQTAAPNSPQWFNTGINWAYGIQGGPQGHYYIDPDTKQVVKATDTYTHPQPHACFIQTLKDDLVNEGGIFDMLRKEAIIFKFGSGSGANYSSLRGKGEKLTAGGTSSGLMSFLKIFDVSAGSIKSGGTTRRAARMVVLNVDHPEIEEFIDWKMKEERKVASLSAGSQNNYKFLKKVIEEYHKLKISNKDQSDESKDYELRLLISSANDAFVPLNYIKRVLMLVDNGLKPEDFTYEKYDTDFRSEAYETVNGQNANNSVRVTNEFMQAVEKDLDWNLIARTDGRIIQTMKARHLLDKMALATWECGDPGVQFHTTINDWHTCPKDGDIVASNPCSEYMFLDETGCNLASINLDKFYDSKTKTFDVEGFKHATRLWLIVLEISILMAGMMNPIMAERTYRYRTTGLGYVNLGAILMKAGIPYDSEKGRNIAGTITAIMTGEAYATSADIARAIGAFDAFASNKEDMMRVMRNHREALTNGNFEKLNIHPVTIDKSLVPNYIYEAAVDSWNRAIEMGDKYGYRNAQTTLIAPTGTIGLVMDCLTTGVEPDFSLIRYKKLVWGGYLKLVNNAVEDGLRNLGYTNDQVGDILKYIEDNLCIEGAPHITEEHLAVFDTANKNGTIGKRYIAPIGHVKMLAYTQPFLSGSISKTINLPETATIKDIKDIFVQSWKMGLKCNALYRDSSKLSQPMTTGSSSTDEYSKYFDFDNFQHNQVISTNNSIDLTDASSNEKSDIARTNQNNTPLTSHGNSNNTLISFDEPRRNKMKDERESVTHKFSVAGHEGYIIVGLFEDGRPGEIFLQMSKEGSTLSGIMDAWAITLSLGLQYGVPLESLVRKFVHARFEPAGMTGNKNIPIAKSIVDYIGRWLAMRFLPLEIAKQFHTEELVERYNLEKQEKDSQRNLFEINKKSNLITKNNLSAKEFDSSTVNESLLEFNGSRDEVIKAMRLNNEDAPTCPECGAVMVRNGACYKCLDCGATSGCS
ncbi:vitamin B12-dependent ribonucleotide reductase [bacterium]|nr:MAG: vitamin B12-dependent ribonucleotide reductase [bacterium]